MSLRTIPAGMLIRLRAGQKPLSPFWATDRHTATGEDFLPTALERDPGDDYRGRHRAGASVGLTQLRVALRDLSAVSA